MIKLYVFAILLSMLSCGSNEGSDHIKNQEENENQGENQNQNITELRFIDDYILPDATVFENTVVGGLSGITYANNTWYMISDDKIAPHFYTAAIAFTQEGFTSVNLTAVTNFKDTNGAVLTEGIADPESIRYANGNVVWTSEGNINNGLPPFVSTATLDGMFVSAATLPERYKPNADANLGPRHNGVFESLTASHDGQGYWVAMELPLKEDGEAPTLEDTDSPIRIAYINKTTNAFEKEIVYEPDPVARPALFGTSFELNGVVELLAYAENKFLVLERSFSTGYVDGGNTVRIYNVDATNATDVSGMDSLIGAEYTKVTKTFLFDFETVRSQLKGGIVDNLEGFTFGPDLENGNKSLILVADNNFSAIIPQLNQFILLEVVS
tara:strand:- start:56544 stop:57692 length:1149 start_codon:yes stop_codon:yes gene_type:complete